MITTQYINLDMTPSGVLPVLYCSQYDIGRPLGMVVYNGSEPVDLSTYTCTIEATRTDGTAITAAVTTSGNIGAFVTTATMTNKRDKYPAKLVLFDSQSRRVASLAFIMCVTPATMYENAESIEEDASLYQQYTGTVQMLIAGIRAELTDLKDQMQLGGNLPISRDAIIFSFHADTHYIHLQAVAASGSTVYAFFTAASGSGYTDTLLVKYVDYVMTDTVNINHAHINDATIKDGKLYYTDGATLYALNSDFSGSETTVAAFPYNTVEYYNGNFYSIDGGNALKKFDTNINLISTVQLEVPKGTLPFAQQGICIHDDLIYSARYYPSAIWVYALDGTPEGFYSIGATNGTYVVGELEAVYWNGSSMIAVTSQFTARTGRDKAHQFFAFDIKRGVTTSAPAVGSGFQSLYVDPASDNPRADGSAAAPYQSATWAVHEAAMNALGNETQVFCKGSLRDNTFTINGANNVLIVPWDNIRWIANAIVIFESTNIYMVGGSIVYGAESESNRNLLTITYSIAILDGLDIDAGNSSKVPIAIAFSDVRFIRGTTSNVMSGVTNVYNASKIIMSRNGDPDSNIVGNAVGPYVYSGTSRIIRTNAYQDVRVVGQYVTKRFVIPISLEENPITANVIWNYNFTENVGLYKEYIPSEVNWYLYGVNANKIGVPYLANRTTIRTESTANVASGTFYLTLVYDTTRNL